MGFEINKIIVAVLVTILVVFGIGKVSDLIFQTEKNVVAYKVEVSAENTTATTVSSETSIDISAFLAIGDAEHGKKVFKKFPNTNFYWVTKSVEEQLLVDKFNMCKNVTFLTYKDLEVWK